MRPQHPLITKILNSRVERLLQGMPIDELQLNTEDIRTLQRVSAPYLLYPSCDLDHDLMFSGIKIIENDVPPFLTRPG